MSPKRIFNYMRLLLSIFVLVCFTEHGFSDEGAALRLTRVVSPALFADAAQRGGFKITQLPGVLDSATVATKVLPSKPAFMDVVAMLSLPGGEIYRMTFLAPEGKISVPGQIQRDSLEGNATIFTQKSLPSDPSAPDLSSNYLNTAPVPAVGVSTNELMEGGTLAKCKVYTVEGSRRLTTGVWNTWRSSLKWIDHFVTRSPADRNGGLLIDIELGPAGRKAIKGSLSFDLSEKYGDILDFDLRGFFADVSSEGRIAELRVVTSKGLSIIVGIHLGSFSHIRGRFEVYKMNLGNEVVEEGSEDLAMYEAGLNRVQGESYLQVGAAPFPMRSTLAVPCHIVMTKPN